GQRRDDVSRVVAEVFGEAEQKTVIDNQCRADQDILERMDSHLLRDFYQKQSHKCQQDDHDSILGRPDAFLILINRYEQLYTEISTTDLLVTDPLLRQGSVEVKYTPSC